MHKQSDKSDVSFDEKNLPHFHTFSNLPELAKETSEMEEELKRKEKEAKASEGSFWSGSEIIEEDEKAKQAEPKKEAT